jgi:Family of unknown function (DUF5681)
VTEDANTPPPRHAGGKFRKGVSGNPGGKKRVVAPAQPEAAQPDNAAKRQGGRFVKGQSGNPAGMPKGTRHHATRLAEALFDGQAEALVQKAIEMALAGDPTAMRLALERLCPPRRERTIGLDMPSIKSATDLILAAAALTEATAAGDITPSEAASLSTLVGNVAKAIETVEIVARLAKLEEQLVSKGSNP